MNEFKERPILFSAPMVRAILDGSKTQTRRVMKPQPTPWCQGMQTPIYTATPMAAFIEGAPIFLENPYGKAGNQLWVRETFCEWDDGFVFAATCSEQEKSLSKFKPSIHMPRRVSRIQLEITGVRVERLNDISEADAEAEGVERDHRAWFSTDTGGTAYARASVAFKALWESINGAGSWAQNPWVWAIEFKRIEKPVAE